MSLIKILALEVGVPPQCLGQSCPLLDLILGPLTPSLQLNRRGEAVPWSRGLALTSALPWPVSLGAAGTSAGRRGQGVGSQGNGTGNGKPAALWSSFVYSYSCKLPLSLSSPLKIVIEVT